MSARPICNKGMCMYPCCPCPRAAPVSPIRDADMLAAIFRVAVVDIGVSNPTLSPEQVQHYERVVKAARA